MKIGDYVRTKKGISKIIKIENEQTRKIIYTDTKDVFEYYIDYQGNEIKDYWINYSTNPKDVIEAGDYVNGLLVIEDSGKSGYVELYLHGYWINTGEDKLLSEVNIESIVTKEQFESMEYKVGE